jgi:hypothetical protein
MDMPEALEGQRGRDQSSGILIRDRSREPASAGFLLN